MRSTAILPVLLLAASLVAEGTVRERIVSIGGDVPRPGPVDYSDDGITIHAAIAAVGMDLTPFYESGGSDTSQPRCPIRIVIYRRGDQTTYDPSVDAVEMRSKKLQVYDQLAVTDFRQHPRKIKERENRIEQMYELGSTEIGAEIRALAALRHDYDTWGKDVNGENGDSLEAVVQKEIVRIKSEGKGPKIIGLLKLQLSALRLDGLGPLHPKVRDIDGMLDMFTEDGAKKANKAQ